MSSIIERVQTIEDAYKEAGVTESNIIPFKDPVDADQRAVNAFAKAQFLTRILNDGREPDNGWWWEIWWWMKDSAGGPGFSASATTARPRTSAPASVLLTGQLPSMQRISSSRFTKNSWAR